MPAVKLADFYISFYMKHMEAAASRLQVQSQPNIYILAVIGEMMQQTGLARERTPVTSKEKCGIGPVRFIPTGLGNGFGGEQA